MFKKFMTVLTVLVVLSTLVMSCASGPKEKAEKPMKKGAVIVGMEGVEQPDWVNKTPKADATFYAIGYSALTSKANAKKAAQADASDQIARWVGTSVKNALTNYSNESGSGKDVQVLTYFENISKQVADQTVVGVEVDEYWVDDKGAIYVKVSFPKANVGKAFEDTVTSFARSDAAAFADFKAKEALSFLDNETKDGVKK